MRSRSWRKMETSEGSGDHSHEGSWAPSSRLSASGKTPCAQTWHRNCRVITFKRCPGLRQCAYLVVTFMDQRFKGTETLFSIKFPVRLAVCFMLLSEELTI